MVFLCNVTAMMVWLLSRVRLCDPVDCSLPASSVHGILQARILEWVAVPCRDLPNPGIKPTPICSVHRQRHQTTLSDGLSHSPVDGSLSDTQLPTSALGSGGNPKCSLPNPLL